MPLALLVLAMLQQPRLTDGPAVPLAVLAGVKPHSVTVDDYWVDGYYSVRFEYRIVKPVSQLAEICEKEKYILSSDGWPAHSSFNMKRSANGVSQTVSISRRVLEYVSSGPKGLTEGKKEDEYTTVVVSESVAIGARPSAYYRGAVSPRPPVPMIEVPFLKGVMTSSVSLTSFDGLMWSTGMMYSGRDAFEFTVLVSMKWEDVRPLFEEWATANGYTKTVYQSWFKPNVRMFEIMAGPYGAGKDQLTTIAVYASDREAVHPIAREKF